MKVLVAGGSGFIGSALAKQLYKKEYTVFLLTRNKSLKKPKHYSQIITWDELHKCHNDFDVIINLCGYNISDKKWSKKTKKKILDSRIRPTEELIKFIKGSKTKLINASAIGFYPFSKEQQTEDKIAPKDSSNTGFSQEITHKWEACVKTSNLKNWCIARFGVVMGNGGFLGKIKPIIVKGLGATFGKGDNLITWVHITDLCNAIDFIIKNDVKGCCNITANANTQKQIMEKIATSLDRKIRFKFPAWFVKLLFGQMGKEMLLSSSNIYAHRLTELGFEFKYTDFDQISI